MLEEVPLPAIRLPSLALAGVALLLQACASAPAGDPATQAVPEPQSVPELTLNLPEKEPCNGVVEEQADYTFLEKGFSALVAGDHVEAVQYFQRYQRLESSPGADWEAGIAIAYDSMLPQSPFYDPQAARKSYQQLQDQQVDGLRFHQEVLMMRDALAAFVVLQQQVSDLQSDKAALTENLQKREEALKRLRELTLGQKGVAQ